MLIRFLVENFLSFREEVEFSMVAGESDEHPDHVVEVRDLHLLKTGAIFGANASGKTNLIKAMSFAQDFIISGSLKTETLEFTPFLLDSVSAEKPARFLFEIQCGIEQSFEYCFLLDRKRVHTESLFEILPASTKMMFERETDSKGRTNVKIGEVNVLVTNEKEPFDFIRNFRPNELFLTAVNTERSAGFGGDDAPVNGTGESTDARETRLFVRATSATSFSPFSNRDTPNRVETRIAYLDIIYDWFDRTLVPVFPDSIPTQGIGLGIMKDTEVKHKLRDVVEFLDLGIDGVKLVEVNFDAETELTDKFREYVRGLVKDIPKGSKERAIFNGHGSEIYLLVDADNNYSAYKLVTLHQVKDENRYVAFDLAAESDGTRRLLELMPSLLSLHSNSSEHVFVIDELDRSIHAHLSCKVVELFLTNGGNNHSQLIVTSHDTGLLDLDLLRRDEVWFIEKDGMGASSLYSLEEFNLPEKMNIEKGYLHGRFGAIPVIPSLESLDWLREV